MACPVCVGKCTCGLGDLPAAPSGEVVSVLIDPEHYDPSEERFAETLTAIPPAPPVGHLDVATELEASTRAVKVRKRLTRELSAVAQQEAETARDLPEWKDEVATRVSRFRSRRRPRTERPRSLTFNFENAAVAETRMKAEAAPAATLLLPAAQEAETEVPAQARVNVVPIRTPEDDYVPCGWEVLALMCEAYDTQRYWPAMPPEVGKPRWRQLEAARQAFEALAEAAVKTDSHQFSGAVIEELTQAVKKFEVRPPTEIRAEIAEAQAAMASTVTAKTNIIEFPQTVEPVQNEDQDYGEEKDLFQLAEPVIEAPPRIFEAEEIPEPPAPAPHTSVPSVVLDESMESQPAAEPSPRIAAAPLVLRAYAAALDSLFVAAGVVVFMLVAQAGGASPTGATLFAATTAAQFLLMGFYQYLFLTRAGRTPGMRQFALTVQNFDRRPVSRARLQARAFAFMLSSAALGLGFIWSLLDEDKLGWHDRITHTYLATR